MKTLTFQLFMLHSFSAPLESLESLLESLLLLSPLSLAEVPERENTYFFHRPGFWIQILEYSSKNHLE